MAIRKKKVNLTITADIEGTRKKITYKVVNSRRLVILDPKDNAAEIADITISPAGKIRVKSLDAARWPADAGKCLLECARGCKGDLFCVAQCGALCSTIIVG